MKKSKSEECKKIGQTLQGDFQHNQRRFWAKIKSSAKGYQEVGKVCDESRQVLCEEEEVTGRWKEYIESLLQGEGAQQTEHRNGNEEEVQAGESRHERVGVEEVRCSIQRLKNRKAPGVCGITGKMLKESGEVVIQWLHNIINLAWRSVSVPADWQKALIIPIHKKGNRTQCKNYCGISVLSIPGKAQKMKYLGSASDEDGSCEAEVDHRIGAASKVVGALKKEVIEQRELNKETKLRVMNATEIDCIIHIMPSQMKKGGPGVCYLLCGVLLHQVWKSRGTVID